MSVLRKLQQGLLEGCKAMEAITKHAGAFTRLPKDRFAQMMREENQGAALLDVLEVESEIMAGQGHVHGYFAGDPHPDYPDNPSMMVNAQIYFDVPDWTTLIAALRAFHETCGPYYPEKDRREARYGT